MRPRLSPLARRFPQAGVARSRSVTGTLVAVLLVAALSACGADEAAGGGAPGFDALEISGDVGSVPEVTFADEMSVESPQTRTVVEGEGATLGPDDQVLVNYWLGNGFTGEPVQDSFGATSAGSLVTLGAPPAPPQTLDQVTSAAVSRLIEEGATVGSRIAGVGTPPQLLELPGVPELGIGNLDPLVLVVDLVAEPLDGPAGDAEEDQPAWVPQLREEDGVPVSWSFDGTPEPTDQLRSSTLLAGEGPEIEKGDVLAADYLGQVYGGEKPFDESYSREPAGFGIGLGQVIGGWDEALVGTTVGSRVVLAVPPDLGYGGQGNEAAGISGDDTLYFAVDILGAA